MIPALLAAAVLLRLLAAGGDLWLDEIWSLQIARELAHPLQIFTSVGIDNNHYLNTWFLFLLRGFPSALLLRLPAVLAGVGSVALAARLAGPVGGAVFALSYWMVHYSSEARGYAFLVPACLAAKLLLEDYARAPERKKTVVFGLACALGLLAHVSFVQALLALFVWAALALEDRRDLWRLFAIPAAVFMLLWIVDLRHLRIGGGDPYSLGRVLFATAGWIVAGSREPIWAGLSVLALVAAVALPFRGDRREGLFLLTAIVLAPALILIVRPAEILYPRYFMVPAIFALLSLARLAARGLAARGPRRAATAALLAGFLVSNGGAIYDLWNLGRGNYRAALRELCTRAVAGGEVTVGSDQDFRNGLVVDYHARALPECRGLRFVTRDAWKKEEPAWVLAHAFPPAEGPPETFTMPDGATLARDGYYPSVELSGWNWYLYRRTH